jgi:hypothetical protein
MLAMAKLLLCLPLCLLMAPAYPPVTSHDPTVTETGPAVPFGDEIAFLDKCLERYDREVKTYTLTMRKRERIDGELNPVEVIKVHYRDKPHSVFFEWVQNPRKALRVLYVEGENDNKMLALPTIKIVGVVARALDSDDAKQSGRYPINTFGLKQAMLRVANNWKKAREDKVLHVEYLGEHKVPEVGNRLCHKFHRTRYPMPEDGGVIELILYVDKETQLQVGSVLLGENGKLIAEYFFKDIRLNVDIPPAQFTRAALTAP